MRDIKFRAWDKRIKEIYIPYFTEFNDMNNGISNIQSDGIKLMQYTSLKDKNGDGLTEVYEGDIISIDGTLKGNIYENKKEPTDIIIPQLGTKAWADAYKEAVDRGYNYSK